MFMPRAKIVEAAAVLSPASFSKPRRVATSIPLVQSCDFQGFRVFWRPALPGCHLSRCLWLPVRGGVRVEGFRV